MQKFEYFAGQQRTPDWHKLRLGIPTSSRLEDWLSVSKAKATLGKPLLARINYEKELLYERTFGVAFENYVTSAMNDGIVYESFAIQEYEKITGNKVDEVGAWYNKFFLASPDGAVGEDGIVEAKVLKDNSFMEVLISGIPPKHYKQVQGQLFASKRQWADYIAINLSTQKLKIIRVLPDKEFFDYLELSLKEQLVVAEFPKEGVYDFVDALPEGASMPLFERNFNNSNEGVW